MPRNAVANREKRKNIRSSVLFNNSSTTVAYSGEGVTGFATASSISGWLKIRKGSTGARIIFARYGTGGSDRVGICFQQRGSAGSENYALQAGYYNGSSYTVSGTGDVLIDTWFHIAFTWDGTTARSYLNGVLQTGTSATPASGVTTGLSLGNQSGAFWNGNMANVKLYTRVLTQTEITSLSLMQGDSVSSSGLWLDWTMDDGAGGSVSDYSGNSRTGTITSGSFSDDSPSKARKLIGGNMVQNGNFEYAPPFTAATTTANRWIDGTSGGSTTNNLFGWSIPTAGVTASASARFDTSVFYSGSASMKLSTLDTSGAITVTQSLSASTIAPATDQDFIVKPNTTYLVSARIKTNNVATNGAYIDFREFSASFGTVTTTSSSKLSGTNDWTLVSFNVTTSSTSVYAEILLRNNVAGNISDAWFDDVSVTPVYPEGRVLADGNIINNSDFEIYPSFTAATNTITRWIDGTASGSASNSTYKWATQNLTGTAAAQFDTSVFKTGSASMELSTLATNSQVGVSPVTATTVAALAIGGIRISPSTSYTCSVWMKTNYVSGDSSDGANIQFVTRDLAGTALSLNVTTLVKTTTDWTQYTVTFTSDATAAYITPRMYVQGTSGAATLIMDAWFDGISVKKTTNPGRILIT